MPRDDYIFGVFSCESQSFVLRCGSEEVVLPRRLFELLIFLVRQGGRIVTKDDLMQSLWPEQMVTENSLSKAVSDLRRILKRYSGEEYIRTVPAIGYQFVAPVDRKSRGGTASSASGQRDGGIRLLLWPLEACSAVRDISRYVCDEVAALVASSDVVQRSRVLVINGSQFSTTLSEARRRCQAAFVVRGSINYAGGGVRVSMELTDANLETRAGEVFDVAMSDVMAAQATIASRLHASSERRDVIGRLRARTEAADIIARGGVYLYKYDIFGRVVEVDPPFPGLTTTTYTGGASGP